MSARGVHFAVTAEQHARLLDAAGNDDTLMAVVENIEETWDEEFLAESDKAWDAMHRCLTDGSLLYESGEYPLNHVICGGRQLFKCDDHTVALVTSEQVRDVASALEPVTKAWFRERYFSLLRQDDYNGEIGDEDFEYTWDWFENVRGLYKKAAASDRAVIFTVDA
ncbi:MAG: DUF1877 family protein [Nitrospira sp.]|nr:YfbM family protein [Nitrospira sp.]TKB76075.1 MAG: DUF1877 family protein [Nitrospira sp.]